MHLQTFILDKYLIIPKHITHSAMQTELVWND